MGSRASAEAVKAEVSWVETGKCTKGTTGVRDQATRERFTEITLGTTLYQQGLAATCKDLLYKENEVSKRY